MSREILALWAQRLCKTFEILRVDLDQAAPRAVNISNQ
jgi:hypothetical protein